jgi:hypothetical protein
MNDNDARLDRLEGDVGEIKDGQSRLEAGQSQLKSDVGVLKAGQAKLDGHFEFMFEKLNDYHTETQRKIDVLIESQNAQLASQGEGFANNRDRLDKHEDKSRTQDRLLDDHELRIRKLEAS